MGLNILFSITHTHLGGSLSTSLNCFKLKPEDTLEVHDKKLLVETAEEELGQFLNDQVQPFYYISVSLFVVMCLMDILVV